MSALTTGQIILVGCFAIAYQLAPIACQALHPRRAQFPSRRKAKAEAARSRKRGPSPVYRRSPKRSTRMPYRSSQLRVVVVKLSDHVGGSATSATPSSSPVSTPTTAVQAAMARSESDQTVTDNVGAAEGPGLAASPLLMPDASPNTSYMPVTPGHCPGEGPSAQANTRNGAPDSQYELSAGVDEDLRSIGYWLISPGIPEARYAPRQTERDRPPVFGLPEAKNSYSTTNESVPGDCAESDGLARSDAREAVMSPPVTGKAQCGEQDVEQLHRERDPLFT